MQLDDHVCKNEIRIIRQKAEIMQVFLINELTLIKSHESDIFMQQTPVYAQIKIG